MIENVVRDTSQQDILQDNFLDFTTRTTGFGSYYGIAGGDLFFFEQGPIRDLQIGDANIGQAVNYFVESFYSFIMADLGQLSSPNVLRDLDILKTFWTACESTVDHSNHNTFAPAGSLPANKFDTLKQTTGPIAISNAMLNPQYLCQIPQRKDTASIVIAVIVANLVLLQAAWKVFTWITTLWLEWKKPDAKFCAGCTQHLASAASSGVAAHIETGRLAGWYEMYTGSVVGPGAAQYAKAPSSAGRICKRGNSHELARARSGRDFRKWMPNHRPRWTEVGVKQLGVDTMHFDGEVEAYDEEGAAEARKAKAAAA